MNNLFGKRLRMLRREKDIVMTDLADALDLTQATLSKYENGKRIPNIEILQRFAKYFNVSSDYLLGKTDNREPYHEDAEDYIQELRDLVAKEGYDISDLSNQELADKIIKAFKLDELYKSD
ncbi:helix-turn-helix domain-containing protein [Gudongella sp. SC589]|uniref:helix-turn-helix domain-containing protein n=1 Tax=Gudongella sp. SC589 TaxID=3385990 RepID=UPI003904C749